MRLTRWMFSIDSIENNLIWNPQLYFQVRKLGVLTCSRSLQPCRDRNKEWRHSKSDSAAQSDFRFWRKSAFILITCLGIIIRSTSLLYSTGRSCWCNSHRSRGRSGGYCRQLAAEGCRQVMRLSGPFNYLCAVLVQIDSWGIIATRGVALTTTVAVIRADWDSSVSGGVLPYTCS